MRRRGASSSSNDSPHASSGLPSEDSLGSPPQARFEDDLMQVGASGGHVPCTAAMQLAADAGQYMQAILLADGRSHSVCMQAVGMSCACDKLDDPASRKGTWRQHDSSENEAQMACPLRARAHVAVMHKGL